MPSAELEEFLDRPFVFRERPAPMPADMRAVWRLPVVLMVVRACRGEKATHEQLHVLSWALRSTDGAATLAKFLEGQLRPEEAVVRFEPALDRAISLAHGFELLALEDGRYWKLTEKGSLLLARIEEDSETLEAERETLGALKGNLSQAAVARILRRETA